MQATASFSQVVSDGLKLTLGASMPEPSKNVKVRSEQTSLAFSCFGLCVPRHVRR